MKDVTEQGPSTGHQGLCLTQHSPTPSSSLPWMSFPEHIPSLPCKHQQGNPKPRVASQGSSGSTITLQEKGFSTGDEPGNSTHWERIFPSITSNNTQHQAYVTRFFCRVLFSKHIYNWGSNSWGRKLKMSLVQAGFYCKGSEATAGWMQQPPELCEHSFHPRVGCWQGAACTVLANSSVTASGISKRFRADLLV